MNSFTLYRILKAKSSVDNSINTFQKETGTSSLLNFSIGTMNSSLGIANDNSFNVSLGQKKIIYAKDNQITISSNLSVPQISALNSELNINADTINIRGYLNLVGTTNINGGTTPVSNNNQSSTLLSLLLVSGNTTLNSSLNVSGASLLKSTLLVLGDTTIDSILTVNKDIFLSGIADSYKTTLSKLSNTTTVINNQNGNTTFNSTLNISGNTNITNILNVSGTTLLFGATTIDSILTVNKDIFLSGIADSYKTTLSKLSNSTTIINNVINNQNGNTTFNSTLNISGNTNITNILNVSGPTLLFGDITINSMLNVSGSTLLFGNTTINSILNVSGTTLLFGNTTIDSILTVNKDIYLAGIADSYKTTLSKLSNTTTVINNQNGNTTFNSTLNISGNTFINSLLTVSGNTLLNSTSINSSLYVSGITLLNTTSINSSLNISGITSIRSALSVNGNTLLNTTSITSSINISGFTSMRSMLSVNGITLAPSSDLTYYPSGTSITQSLITKLNSIPAITYSNSILTGFLSFPIYQINSGSPTALNESCIYIYTINYTNFDATSWGASIKFRLPKEITDPTQLNGWWMDFASSGTAPITLFWINGILNAKFLYLNQTPIATVINLNNNVGNNSYFYSESPSTMLTSPNPTLPKWNWHELILFFNISSVNILPANTYNGICNITCYLDGNLQNGQAGIPNPVIITSPVTPNIPYTNNVLNSFIPTTMKIRSIPFETSFNSLYNAGNTTIKASAYIDFSTIALYSGNNLNQLLSYATSYNYSQIPIIGPPMNYSVFYLTNGLTLGPNDYSPNYNYTSSTTFSSNGSTNMAGLLSGSPPWTATRYPLFPNNWKATKWFDLQSAEFSKIINLTL